MRRIIVLICLLLVAAPLLWLYSARGIYGFNVVLRRGGSIWPSVTPPRASSI